MNPRDFIRSALDNGCQFMSGVPDSLLKSFCLELESIEADLLHVPAVCEGSAVSLAAGSYLACGKVPLVYMQNSGLGNAINPLNSILHPDVYSIPIVLLIGWRGEIDEGGMQVKDEPQHRAQGRLTRALLDACEIPFRIANSDSDERRLVREAFSLARRRNGAVAILVRKDSFSNPARPSVPAPAAEGLRRSRVIETIVRNLDVRSPIFCNTGKSSRELYCLVEQYKLKNPVFMCVGGMGYVGSIASGFAASTDISSRYLCLDGDGSFLMHMGGQVQVGLMSRMDYVLLNNQCHESVGGQDTLVKNVDLEALALGLGFSKFILIKTYEQLEEIFSVPADNCSRFIEVRCDKHSAMDLPRPADSMSKYKQKFMESIGESNE